MLRPPSIALLLFSSLLHAAVSEFSEYSPIREGDRFEFRYHKVSAYSNPSMGPGYRNEWTGSLSLVYAGVNPGPEAVSFEGRFTDRPDGGVPKEFLQAFRFQGGYLYTRTSSGFYDPFHRVFFQPGLRDYPVLVDFPVQRDTNSWGFARNAVDSMLVLDTYEVRDSTYFLKGVGPVFSKRTEGGGGGYYFFSEKYQLAAVNGVPFNLNDHLKVPDPVSLRPIASKRAASRGPVREDRQIDAAGRRQSHFAPARISKIIRYSP